MRGLARLDGPGRLPGVDLARGLAVLGMFASHLITVDPFDFSDPATWSDIAYGRSSILFATLAGVSIGLVTGGPRPVRGGALRTAALRLVVRAALLWILGVLLIATGVPIANILPAYALLFLVALPFLTLRARVLLPLAMLLGVLTPFLLAPVDRAAGGALEPGSEGWALTGWEYPFIVWIAFVLAGLGLARADLRVRRTQIAAVAGGVALAVVGYGLGAAAPVDPATEWGMIWTSEGHSSGLLEVVGSGGFAIAVIGLCCLLCRTVVRAALLPLRAVGSMPLTAYTVQVLVWWVVATSVVGDVDDLLGIRDLGFFWYLALGVLAGCTAWALFVGRGPLEWALDTTAQAIIPAPRRPSRPDADAGRVARSTQGADA